jgi:hypothetical protein
MEGSFKKRERALEDQYMNKLNEEQKKAFAEKIHKNELRQLLAILPEGHGLSEEVLMDIVHWKHGH